MFVALAKKYNTTNALNEIFEARAKNVDKSDLLALFKIYLGVYNPLRVDQAESLIAKYKGKEQQMFKAFATKWYAINPFDDSQKSDNAPKSTGASSKPTTSSSSTTLAPAPAPTASFSFGSGMTSSLPSAGEAKPSFGSSGATDPKPPTSFGASVTAAPSPFGSSAPTSGPVPASPFGAAPAPTSNSPFASSSGGSAFGSTPVAASTSPFGSSSGTNAFGSSNAFGAAASSPSPFGSTTSSSTFGQAAPAPAPGPSPFSQTPATPAAPTSGGSSKFGGRNPRDMLYEFYKTHNPTKVNEVDKLIAKYAGKEEQLFANLAKKYNIDPSIFGIPATQPQANATPVFGSPAPLGGSTGFGATSPFGGTPATSTFGTPSPSAGFGASGGGGFAAAAGGSTFGSLAASSGGAFGGFGGAPAPTPFGGPSPFGAARR